MKNFYLILMTLLITVSTWSQKIWNGPATGGNWAMPANWSGNSVPSTTDIVQFDGGISGTITNVPNQQIGGLIVTDNSNVNLSFSGSDPVTILTIENLNGNGNTDFTINAGSQLTIGGTNISGITLAHGAKASINGVLTVNAGRTYDADNNNTLTTVSGTGTIDNKGVVNSTKNNRLIFQSGATYIHARDGGNIPEADWDDNSNCNITGITVTVPVVSTLNQEFGNFTWNNPGQSGNLSFERELRSVDGNFTVSNTGTASIYLGNTGNRTINIKNYIQTGGTLVMANTSGNIDLMVNGNFSMTGGVLSRNGGTCNITFTGNSPQTFTKTVGTIAGIINFSIDNNAIVDFGTSVLDGTAATFNLNSNAKIITSNPSGLASAGNNGSIQVGGTRIYNSNADYEFRGASTGIFSTAPNPQVRDLIINNITGNVTLSQAMTVGGDLVLTDGELNTSSLNLLTLIDGAIVTGASNSSFVNGPIRKIGNDAFVFPVGKSGTGYVPIGIGAVGGAGNTFIAEYIRQTPPNNSNIAASTGITKISNCEYWTLDRTAGTTAVNVTLNWNTNSPCNAGPYVTQPSSMRVVHYNTATGQWDAASNLNGGGTPAVGSVTWTGVNTFSPFTLGTTSSTENPLPVVFADVKAYEKNNGVQIEWSNLTEKDVANYTIERSTNGRDFAAIASQLPTSNQDDKSSYDAFDAAPHAGSNYYRIKAEETTGKIVYSKILSVNMGKEELGLKLYPNPVSGNQVTISLSNAKRGQYDLRVVNMAGQDIFKQAITNHGSSISQTLDLPSTVKPGVYNMIITGSDFRETKMFIVQ